MVASLTGLQAFNDAQGKRVCVWVKADNQPTDSTIDFLICAKHYPKQASLAANQSAQVCVNHQESGGCWVVVTASGSTATTKKYFNL